MAGWAEMSAALSNSGALDRRAAGWAGFAGALVNAEIVLELAAPVNPVNAGTVAADALLQDSAKRSPQALSLFKG